MRNSVLFTRNKEKENIKVGFSRNEFRGHGGISGLKYYLIVMYLRKHLQTFGQISMTLSNLLEECGYSTKSHNNSIYSDFREIIKTELIKKDYASCNADILTVSPSEMFNLQLLESKNIFYVKDNFVQFSISEYEKIVKSDNKNKSLLAGVYLFIKQYILDCNEDALSAPRISYPSKRQIKNGIGISSLATIEKMVSALEDMKMLYVRKNMFVEDSKNKSCYVPTRNVFALNEKELIGDRVLFELEKIYKKKIYNRGDVPGKIQYLSESNNE